MGWTKRVDPPHKHDNPNTAYKERDREIRVGDQWTCACGTVLEVTEAKYHADQRDGDFYFLKWKEVAPSYKDRTCEFVKSWVGTCGKPASMVNASGFAVCIDHEKDKCYACKAQATHDCEATIGAFVCGTPMCSKHSHHH